MMAYIIKYIPIPLYTIMPSSIWYCGKNVNSSMAYNKLHVHRKGKSIKNMIHILYYIIIVSIYFVFKVTIVIQVTIM